MDLHPYDGVERRFRHGDADPSEGPRIVARVLASPAPVTGARYDLSFYSGGTGVLDRLAIALPAARAVELAARLGLVAAADVPDLESLLDDEEPFRFVARERRDFQPPCEATDPLFWDRDSGPNAYVVVWEHDGVAAYLAFDQG